MQEKTVCVSKETSLVGRCNHLAFSLQSWFASLKIPALKEKEMLHNHNLLFEESLVSCRSLYLFIHFYFMQALFWVHFTLNFFSS